MRKFVQDATETDQPVILRFDAAKDRKASTKHRCDEQTLGQYIPLAYHYNMLQDDDRVGAFKAAIELLVRPGMRVLELGSGTGILSSFAAKVGASVTCVERNPELVACSRRFLTANGLQQRAHVIAEDASSWTPNHPVDVVICEMLHVGLLREKQAQVISAFKLNYAKKFGKQFPVFIPEVSILMCQPIQQCFDFAGYVAPVPMFQAPTLNQPRTQEVAGLQAYQTIDYATDIETHFDVTQAFTSAIDGHVNAIRLVTQNVLAVDEPGQRAITWPNQCLVLPIPTPISCAVGGSVELSLNYVAGESIESVRYGVIPGARRYYENVG